MPAAGIHEKPDDNKSPACNTPDNVFNEGSTETRAPADADKGELHDPAPDGGLRAWLALLGSWCMLFCTFGLINCKELQ